MRLLMWAQLIALAAASSTVHGTAPQSQPIFRSAVEVVTIQATVRDDRGRLVTGLTATDFEVWDNGDLRPILSLRSDRQTPLSVAIVVDMSGSMRIGPKMQMARHAYASLLSQLRQGEDEVALFTFDASLHERGPFTRDVASLRDALSDFESFGATSLFDAVADGAQRLAARPSTHKAIIVLTDGVDTSSTMTARELSGLASSINVPVFIMATVPAIDQSIMADAVERDGRSDVVDLRNLADWTGGRFLFATNAVETVAVSSRLIDDLRQQYVLAIQSAGGRDWRRLDVRVRRPSSSVRARSGYFPG